MSRTSSITIFRREVRKQLQERFMKTDAYDILSKMLSKDPAQRYDARECLGDPYIVGRPSQSTSVGLFKAALAMTTSDERQLKIALHHQRKVKSPLASRPALRGAARGITRDGPGADGRVLKIKGPKRAFLKQSLLK
jgi:serine/threonine protein kinase